MNDSELLTKAANEIAKHLDARRLFKEETEEERRARNAERWRRLWRQKIQDYLIAAIQNMRILLAHQDPKRSAAMAAAPSSAFNHRVFALNFLHGMTAYEPAVNEALEPPRSLTNALLSTLLAALNPLSQIAGSAGPPTQASMNHSKLQFAI